MNALAMVVQETAISGRTRHQRKIQAWKPLSVNQRANININCNGSSRGNTQTALLILCISVQTVKLMYRSPNRYRDRKFDLRKREASRHGKVVKPHTVSGIIFNLKRAFGSTYRHAPSSQTRRATSYATPVSKPLPHTNRITFWNLFFSENLFLLASSSALSNSSS